MSKFILRTKNPNNAALCLRAILSSIRDGHRCCAYGYGDDDITVLVKHNKSSITATTQDYYE